MSFFFRRKNSAGNAKERLQLVLIHDRTDLTSTELTALKDDLIATISRHIEIDPTAVNINLAQEGRSQKLVANIPLRSTGHRRPR